MRRKLAVILALILIGAITLGGCSNPEDMTTGKQESIMNKESKLTIYTTFYPMYFLAEQICKDKAEIINLTPAGAEPHDWEPTPKTIAAMQSGDMFIYNGVEMEKWTDKILQIFDSSKIKIVCASDGIELIGADKTEHEDNHDHGNFDPHLWVSPVRYMQQAENVYNAIVEIDPENKEYYSANYNNLIERLSKLDKDMKEEINGFKSKVIVTSHDAFGYLAHDYGIKQISIRGVTPSEEPSPAKMAELVRECRENNAKYIFFEKLVSPKLSETLAKEVGADTLILNAVHGLEENDNSSQEDYITIMYDNLENLKKALGE